MRPHGLRGPITRRIGRESLRPIPWIYAEIVRLISAGERVRILVQNAAARGKVEKILERAGVNLRRLIFLCIQQIGCGCKDSGPIFLKAQRHEGTKARSFSRSCLGYNRLAIQCLGQISQLA